MGMPRIERRQSRERMDIEYIIGNKHNKNDVNTNSHRKKEQNVKICKQHVQCVITTQRNVKHCVFFTHLFGWKENISYLCVGFTQRTQINNNIIN